MSRPKCEPDDWKCVQHGKACNPVTGRCVSTTSKIGRDIAKKHFDTLGCADRLRFVRHPKTGVCLPRSSVFASEDSPEDDVISGSAFPLRYGVTLDGHMYDARGLHTWFQTAERATVPHSRSAVDEATRVLVSKVSKLPSPQLRHYLELLRNVTVDDRAADLGIDVAAILGGGASPRAASPRAASPRAASPRAASPFSFADTNRNSIWTGSPRAWSPRSNRSDRSPTNWSLLGTSLPGSPVPPRSSPAVSHRLVGNQSTRLARRSSPTVAGGNSRGGNSRGGNSRGGSSRGGSSRGTSNENWMRSFS